MANEEIVGLNQLPIPEAPYFMVIHHAHCLHVGINYGATHEFEPPFF